MVRGSWWLKRDPEVSRPTVSGARRFEVRGRSNRRRVSPWASRSSDRMVQRALTRTRTARFGSVPQQAPSSSPHRTAACVGIAGGGCCAPELPRRREDRRPAPPRRCGAIYPLVWQSPDWKFPAPPANDSAAASHPLCRCSSPDESLQRGLFVLVEVHASRWLNHKPNRTRGELLVRYLSRKSSGTWYRTASAPYRATTRQGGSQFCQRLRRPSTRP